MRQEEMVVLVQAHQWCAIQSGMSPGMLCRVVQELHRCLAPLLERGNLLDITMLHVAEKDPVTLPIPTERASSLEQKPECQEEEPTTLPAPSIQEASKPEGAAHLGEVAIMQRRLPSAPLGFTSSWVDESSPPPRGSGLAG